MLSTWYCTEKSLKNVFSDDDDDDIIATATTPLLYRPLEMARLCMLSSLLDSHVFLRFSTKHGPSTSASFSITKIRDTESCRAVHVLFFFQFQPATQQSLLSPPTMEANADNEESGKTG